MSTVSELRPHPPRKPPPAVMGEPTLDGLDHFWSDALGSALLMAAELGLHLDLMSASIAQLPQRNSLSRPAVTAYLNAIKGLADDWRRQFRPGLDDAADALATTAASMIVPSARKSGAGRAPGSKTASQRLSTSAKRMSDAVVLLDHLSKRFDEALAHMVRASSELDADTIELSERLQADQVHALMLSQQASTLQSKLDDATMRQHAYWLLGPHAEQIRQEIAMHNSAREGVRRQLDHLRAEQMATEAEARYLQQLLPSLSTYLCALDRLSGAMRAMLGACRALLSHWRNAPAGDLDTEEAVLAGMRQAAPHWTTLAATADRLRRPAEGGSVRTPDGCRT